MRLERSISGIVVILSLLLATSQAHASFSDEPITNSIHYDIVVGAGESLFLDGYERVIVFVEDGLLTGDELIFQSGGSIDFDPPPVNIVGNVVELCASPACGPYAGFGEIFVFLATNVEDITIQASNQIRFKSIPAVPEPATAVLVGGALLTLGARRRRTH